MAHSRAYYPWRLLVRLAAVIAVCAGVLAVAPAAAMALEFADVQANRRWAAAPAPAERWAASSLSAELADALGATAEIPAPFARAMAAEPSHTIPLLAIVVGFDGGDAGTDAVPYAADFNWHDRLFGASDSVAAYYRDMSGGEFAFVPAAEACASGNGFVANAFDAANDGVVHVTLHRPHGWWDDAANEAKLRDMNAMLAEALAYAATWYVDLPSYDANGDGELSAKELAVLFVVAGPEAAVLGGPAATEPSFWSRAGSWGEGTDPSPLAASGVTLNRCIAMAEYVRYPSTGLVRTGVLSVAVHELAHYLGLPDLYDTVFSADEAAAQPWGAWKVANLSVLADGYEGATGDPADPATELVPVSLDAWSRYVLGWGEFAVATREGEYEIRSQESTRGYAALLIPTGDERLYYLVENREPEGWDKSLHASYPGYSWSGGAVVWVVDKWRFWESAFWNNVNAGVLQPTVMPVYSEADASGALTLNWAQPTVPQLNRPFWTAGLVTATYGPDTSGWLQLPAYGEAESARDPLTRTGSSVWLAFPSRAGRTMRVIVSDNPWRNSVLPEWSLPAEPATEERLAADARTSHSSPLGRLVCASMIDGTAATLALCSAGTLTGDLPAGTLTYAAVDALLPHTARLSVYELDGPDLKAILERSLEIEYACARAAEAEASGSEERMAQRPWPAERGALFSIGGLSLQVNWDAGQGSRIVSAALPGGEPFAFDHATSVAMNVCDAEELQSVYPELARAQRYEETLWGYTSDAVRSFLLTENWEQRIGEICG